MIIIYKKLGYYLEIFKKKIFNKKISGFLDKIK